MAHKKDGRPRKPVYLTPDVARRPAWYMSMDCRDGRHEACAADGGCPGCECHLDGVLQ